MPTSKRKGNPKKPLSEAKRRNRHEMRQVLGYTQRQYPWNEFEDAIFDDDALQRFLHPFVERHLMAAAKNQECRQRKEDLVFRKARQQPNMPPMWDHLSFKPESSDERSRCSTSTAVSLSDYQQEPLPFYREVMH